MRLKSYFADSVQAAMNQARIELGPEAMLIDSSQTGQELKELGQFEVVFGLPREPAPASFDALYARQAPAAESGTDLVLRELAELRRQIESFGHTVSRFHLQRFPERMTPEVAYLFNRLLTAGFSQDLSLELAEAVAPQVHAGKPDGVLRIGRDARESFARELADALLDEEIASRFAVAPTLGDETRSAASVMLVGPSGAGKTTSLVKLAFEYGLKARRPVHLLSLDTLRIGGWEHLNAYARIGGIDFRPLPDARSLEAAVSDLADKGLVLIDTPGFGKAEEGEAEELAQVARQLPIEVHLVLPAHASLAFTGQSAKGFARFSPAKLVLTHTDAVEGSSGIVELAMRSGLPLSFLGTGQQVPEDLCKASKSALTEGILPRARAASMAA